MSKKKLLFIIFLFFSNITFGQDEWFVIEKGIHGDTVLAISLPNTSFFVDCDSDYSCMVSCIISFAEDSLNVRELDSFLVEKIELWMVQKMRGDKYCCIYRRDSEGGIDSSLIDDCLTSTVMDEFFSFVTNKVQHGHFYSQQDYINLPNKKIMFNFRESIKGGSGVLWEE